MASPSYSEDLNCSLCLTLFNSPVVLPCGHSFCSPCITEALSARQQCPLCSSAVAAEEAKCLPANLILKSLVEKAQRGDQAAKAAGMCPEHEEKFKLFCLTDLQLACIICRDGEKHEGHKFKPIKEAAQSLRSDLETFLQRAAEDINATEQLTKAQRENIKETREKSKQLMVQISRQFQEMHQFLRKREDEINNELKCQEADAVEKMMEALTTMETALCESKELESKAASALKITDPEKFLRTWTEGGSPMTRESLFKSRANTLQVVNRALSLEQYESHLQLFMWKEMLQVISPREERLTLKSSSPNVSVSDDGRSVFCAGALNQPRSGVSFGGSQSAQAFSFGVSQSAFGTQNRDLYGTPAFETASNTTGFWNFFTESPSKYSTLSTTEFITGQHYWEINVGNRDFWEVGINNNFLQYKQQKYAACYPDRIQELALENKPKKIGIYLNLSSNKLIFFNAGNMTKIHSRSLAVMSEPVSAYISMTHRNPDYSPLTVCWF
ncbi:nuclear factor 7, brain [Oryzias melastigma]|uniref:Nuclear factor 7, brain-like n=1 Tax=Oryzias melastigma TaxID=30732 RepID=A0A3B3BS70_ORYME|nr:nuclear factor 7, brain [Oryzias melastigma]